VSGGGALPLSAHDNAWVLLHVCDESWCEELDTLAADELPDRSFRWLADEPLLHFDETGNGHLLLTATEIGFWRGTSRTVYLVQDDCRWSAPLEIGESGIDSGLRLLALESGGAVFAAWPDRSGRFVGRWLR
jgi:hypothetical protein